MHVAHRDLILKARAIANAGGLPLGIFTFPAEDGIKKNVGRLYSTEEKLGIFAELGADFTVLADFSSVAALSPEAFVLEVLSGALGATECVAGFNFRFGRGASGDAAMLSELMESIGARATICDELTSDGRTVSTSAIREYITAGDMPSATGLLGAPYMLSGRVLHGNKEGRRLGYPTVNTPIGDGKIVPRLGVYMSAVRLDSGIYPALTNIGKCPTFAEREVHAETYILGYTGDLYGEKIAVYLLDFLREERRFSSPEELVMQINIDKNRVIEEIGDKTWQELGLN